MRDKTPLDAVLDEMNSAVDAGLNLVALSVAVAIPAICASLMMADGRSQRQEYIAWCSANLKPDNGFAFLTPEELYSLRCGLLHQGQSSMTSFHRGVTSSPYPHSAAIFTVENGTMNIGENSSLDQYINSVRAFCRDISLAARKWLDAESGNPVVQKNIASMMSYKPFSSSGISIDPPPMAIY